MVGGRNKGIAVKMKILQHNFGNMDATQHTTQVGSIIKHTGSKTSHESKRHIIKIFRL